MRIERSVVVLAFVFLAASRAAAAPEQMTLDVDATDLPRKILHAKITLPAKPGPLKLFYPKWIPGEHGPTGPVNDLAGVRINARGKAVPWRRDDLDMYVIGCDVPAGVDSVEVCLDYLVSSGRTFSGGASATAKLGVLSWNHVLLYPAGKPARDIPCRASIRLPRGWKLGTALPVASRQGERTEFAPVSLETLVDSPVLCGVHLREVPIGPPGAPQGASAMPPHFIVMACDSDEGLKLSPELKANYDRLVSEAAALFGNHRYEAYRFLLTLSDHTEHFGLEHHASSDNRAPERVLLDDDIRKGGLAALLPHEFVHAWNGKYRRPADMITPTFQEPLRTRLLWVYEGLTEYLGFVLTARSGIWTDAQARDVLAAVSQTARDQRGRTWRPLDDTAAAAQLLYQAPDQWQKWRRGTDFYDEGALLWLEIDTTIRQKTSGSRSLDDFCRRFFAGDRNTPPGAVKAYTLDDVVAELNAVTPHDWRVLIDRRVAQADPEPPLQGIAAGGWKLGYGDEPSEFQKESEKADKYVNESATLGFVVTEEGVVGDVVPDGPAFRAGVGPGMKLVAVNGRKLSPEVLRDAIAATGGKEHSGKIDLLCENDDFFRTFTAEYRGGKRYPRLERDESRPDLLASIFRPLSPPPAPATAPPVAGQR